MKSIPLLSLSDVSDSLMCTKDAEVRDTDFFQNPEEERDK